MEKNLLINTLKEQVKPAIGCTEPIAVALACAKAVSLTSEEVKNIEIVTSKAVYKNAYSVGIPGTKERGMLIAGALGAICGDSSLELEVLKKVNTKAIDKAKEMIKDDIISMEFTSKYSGVYIECKLYTENDSIIVRVEGSHTNFNYIQANDKVISDNCFVNTDISNEDKSKYNMSFYSIEDIVNNAINLELSDISFLLDGIEMNTNIALYGINNKIGLGLGQALNKLKNENILCNDIVYQVRLYVSAASDARMNGVKLPVMTSGGSGNQGILTILPVALVADYLQKDEEEKVRALAISHLINTYVKEVLGKLAPVCGAAVSASLGATAAISWLLGGDYKQITGAMKTVISNLTGMLCDGAKATCSLKVATSAVEAVMAAYLSLENVYPYYSQGIIENSIEKTIQNIFLISNEGMKNIDDSILEILVNRIDY